jgi:hypothetical protein
MIAGALTQLKTSPMMITNWKRALAIALLAVCIAACNNNNNNKADINANAHQQHADSSRVEVYTFPTQQGFGYSIIVDHKEFIRQDCIPVIQGNKPFPTEVLAAQTGKLVAQKIRNNELPTLTLQELNNLGITQQ